MTIRDAAAFFRRNDDFRILTHRAPDGDTAGCASALCRGLRAIGKRAFVIENPQLTPRYAPLLEGLMVPAEDGSGTLVSVDLASEGLLPDNMRAFAGKIQFAIDHHGSNTRFAAASLIDPGAAACGEIIYALLRELGAPVDGPAAQALYVALATDTGCFQYSNTTANTLRVAASLYDAGAGAAALNRALFGVKSMRRLRLEARLTGSMTLLADGRIAVCRLPLALCAELGLTEDDLDSIAGFPRSVEGVEAGITLREKAGGQIKISVRSGPSVDAARVCARLGGGGHPAAAGAVFDGSFDEALAALREALAREGMEG